MYKQQSRHRGIRRHIGRGIGVILILIVGLTSIGQVGAHPPAGPPPPVPAAAPTGPASVQPSEAPGVRLKALGLDQPQALAGDRLPPADVMDVAHPPQGTAPLVGPGKLERPAAPASPQRAGAAPPRNPGSAHPPLVLPAPAGVGDGPATAPPMGGVPPGTPAPAGPPPVLSAPAGVGAGAAPPPPPLPPKR